MVFQLLGVSVTATEKELKKGYRKMCLQWVRCVNARTSLTAARGTVFIERFVLLLAQHPDKHSQSKDGQHRASCVFKCIQQAYEELSDPLKRIMYDMELRRKGSYTDEVPTTTRRSPPPSKV